MCVWVCMRQVCVCVCVHICSSVLREMCERERQCVCVCVCVCEIQSWCVSLFVLAPASCCVCDHTLLHSHLQLTALLFTSCTATLQPCPWPQPQAQPQPSPSLSPDPSLSPSLSPGPSPAPVHSLSLCVETQCTWRVCGDAR